MWCTFHTCWGQGSGVLGRRRLVRTNCSGSVKCESCKVAVYRVYVLSTVSLSSRKGKITFKVTSKQTEEFQHCA